MPIACRVQAYIGCIQVLVPRNNHMSMSSFELISWDDVVHNICLMHHMRHMYHMHIILVIFGVLFEYLEYPYYRYLIPRFHVVLQVHARRVRTTCPATLIVAWLVNLYIVFKRYLIGHSLLCYNHPPLKIHVIPLACNYFRYRWRRNLFGYRLVNPFVFAFKQLSCRMCYFTSQARKAVLTSCVLLSQLDNDCLE